MTSPLSTNEYQILAEQAPVMIWRANTSAECDYFNDGWLHFRGRRFEEECGNQWAEGVHPDDRGRRLATYLAAFEKRQPFEMEYRLRRYDGVYRWVLDRGSPFDGSNYEFCGYIGTCIDITERVERTQDVLRESAEQFVTIANCIPDTLFSMDLSGNYTYVSPAVERMYGWTVAEALKLKREKLVTPRQVAKSDVLILKELELARTPGYDRNRVITFESEQFRKDGSTFWVEISASFIWGSDGKPTGWTGVARDITDRKRIEVERERFRAIFNQTFQFIGLLATDGTVIAANRAALDFAGISEQDVLGKPFWETAWWSHSGDLQQELRRAIESAAMGQFVRFEATHPGADGAIHTIDFSLKPVRDEQGQVTLLIPEGRDITERKMAEKAREKAEQQYREIFEGAVEGFFRTSPAGRSLSANPALVRMLGYSSREEFVAAITDSAHQVWLDPAERQRHVELLERQGEVRGYECQCRRKDGTIIWVSLNTRRVCGEDGTTVYHEGFIEDITARKQAELEREKLLAQLAQAQKMESIGRLAGGVAHDFNNLLTVINGHARLALGRLQEANPLRARLLEILKAGERAANLTQQLLAFSRKQVLQPRVFDLNEVASQMRSILEPLMGDDVDLRLKLDPERIPVFADPHQLEQVIMNLAINARDAMPGGGCLRIGTTVAHWYKNHSAAGLDIPPGRYAVLTVADTGSGIDEGTRQRIFEPFFTTKEAGMGTGLGLAMVQGIVAQSGGYIDLETAPGEGTEFKIFLPLRDDDAEASKDLAAVARSSEGEMILIVEDRSEVRHYAADALREYGYRVIEAATADEALLLSRREGASIHLVLADVMMPGCGGADLVSRLAESQPGMKAVFMSGYSEEVVRHRPEYKGCRFIQKPFAPDELANSVRTVLVSAELI